MSLQVKKLHKKFGAEIINFDLSKSLNNKYFKEILKNFNEYGILLFRNQNLSIKKQEKKHDIHNSTCEEKNW